MSTEEDTISDLLFHARCLLSAAEDLIRPDTEYLRDEVRRLLGQVDSLQEKVEKEEALVVDKQALQ